MTDSALRCRLCAAAISQVFVDLGKSPLSNAYLKREHLDRMEPFYPLCAYVCERCLLVQLPVVEKRENIFADDYAYFSSFSDSLLRHSEAYAKMMIPRFGLGKSSLVVELASNDGYLLQYFKQAGVPVLGVEPSGGVARAAIEKKGIPTVVRFFGVQTAKDLKAEGKTADLIAGNNVLAHVPDLHDFIGGMKILLGPKGVITVEFPHLMQLMHENEFDTIYHEHFSYFSFQTARKAFEANGLRVFDVEEVATHGGSFRVFACHAEDASKAVSENVNTVERREKAAGLDTLSTYVGFGDKVNKVKRDLLAFLIKAKEEGKRVVGYGAPAKANTLFNYCGIRRDFVDFTADRSPHKQGQFLPGSHVPIVPPAEIEACKPDYILILPWNLKEEIMTQLVQAWQDRAWGAKFVVAIPRLQILGMKRVLVTGAGGFIGRYTLAPLVARGYEVHVADLRRPQLDTPVPFVWHETDLLAPGAPQRLVDAVKPSHLLHLAWYAKPGLYWNAAENLAFLAASTELVRSFRTAAPKDLEGGARLVIAGSCAEYDWQHGYCTEGVTPLGAGTLYGVTKDALRRVTETYAQGGGLSFAWARPFFLYGPHEHPKRLVASLITSLLAGQPALMTHGRQIRDLMHVEDVGAALVALLDSKVEGAVNIASGVPTTLAAVATELASLIGGKDLLRLGAVAAAPAEAPLVVGNPRRLHDEVGFSPKYDLKAGLGVTVRWWRAAAAHQTDRD